MNAKPELRYLGRQMSNVLILTVLITLSVLTGAPVFAQQPGEESAGDTPAYNAGPQTWLEFPLDGQILSVGPVVFDVYAADPAGIAQIDLRVNGETLPAAAPVPLGNQDNKRLVFLKQECQPTQEGEYIAEARARNAAGNYGEPSYVKFCVGDCQTKKPPTPGPEPAPLVASTNTPAPAQIMPTDTPAPATPAGYDLYVRRMDYTPANPAVGDGIQMAIMLATDIAPQGATFFPASHFRWRQGANFPWNEETCPDNTQYASCVKNVSFTYNQPGSYVVEVEADSRQAIAETDEANNVKTWTIVVGQQQPSAPTFTPAPGYDLYVRRMDFMQTNPLAGDAIELSIMLATDIAPQGAPFFPASHFRWRQGPGFPWNEESCPDNSQYASCVKSVTFTYNQPGSYVVEVQADHLQAINETDESNNTGAWTLNVGQAQEPPPPAQAEIHFCADPTTIYPGQCAVLFWEVTGVEAVYLDGEGVAGAGNRQVCPAEATVYTLQVIKVGGAAEDYPVTVNVQGTIGSPEQPPPIDSGIGSPEFPPELPPAQDTSGPAITGMGLRWEGCQFYGYATITDDSGVSWAQFHFNDYGASNEWRSLWMADKGGGYWEAEYPVQATPGTGVVDYAVYADDTIGNHTESEMLGDTYECSGSEIPQTFEW